MCLDNAIRINPENDIVCYKLFYKCPFAKDNNLYSVFQQSPYKLNNTKSTRVKQPKVYCSEYGGKKTYQIHQSALHSFANYGDTVDYKEKSVFKGACIVKCIIPKNSEYVYFGVFDNKKSYASQKLKPVEIIEQSISED